MTNETLTKDWYLRSFGALYPVIYAHRTVEAAEPEAAFAADRLGLMHGENVLDLCCGNGRHMVHLLRRTPFVTGLDYSADLLALARETIGGGARLVRGDMRALPFASLFDVVTSFFTSFGYFASEEENLCVVREMARALKPRGRFFIDYFDAAFVEKNLVPESVREYKGYVIQERRWIDPLERRVNKHMAVSRAEEAVGEWSESVRLYTEAEFRALLSSGGLAADGTFGDYDGSPLDAMRPRMMVIGHKE